MKERETKMKTHGKGKSGSRWPAKGEDGSCGECLRLEDLAGKDVDLLALTSGLHTPLTLTTHP